MKNYEKIINQLLARIAELKESVALQAARIAELEKRLSQNSSNSSKPPSSDGLKKPVRTSSLREQGKHQSGGQKGHKGKALNQVTHAESVVTHKLEQCPDCGASLLEQAAKGKVAYEQLQPFETKVLAFAKEAPVKNLEKKHDLINALNSEWNDLYPSIL